VVELVFFVFFPIQILDDAGAAQSVVHVALNFYHQFRFQNFRIRAEAHDPAFDFLSVREPDFLADW